MLNIIVDILKGAASILLAGIPLLFPQVRELLIVKYQNSLDKALEDRKSKNERKNYVSKVRFDKEFEIYSELSEAFFELVAAVNSLIPAGYTQVPADKEIAKKHEVENYDKLILNKNAALKSIQRNAPFIPKCFHEAYLDIIRLSTLQMNCYSQRWNVLNLAPQAEKETLSLDDYKRTDEINTKFGALNDELRAYLKNLEVID